MTPIKPTSELVVTFLKTLDGALSSTSKIDLFLGGGAAVQLAYGGREATDDVDAIGESSAVLRGLRELAGRDSEIQQLTGYYFDIVPPAMFPFEQGWRERCARVDIPGLKVLRVHVLDPYDLVISKLGPKRFGPKDREDVRDVCDHAELAPEILRERYLGARQMFDRDQQQRMDDHFRTVETEFLQLPPTAL